MKQLNYCRVHILGNLYLSTKTLKFESDLDLGSSQSANDLCNIEAGENLKLEKTEKEWKHIILKFEILPLIVPLTTVMLRLHMPTNPCAFICINSAHRKWGIVGLFPKFSYEIRHNLVELFRAKTNMIVVYRRSIFVLNLNSVHY